MLLIHTDQRAPQPWRNGRGQTRELLAQPSGPGWTVRVSLADIEADGPFSSFPGVQRWFVVVDGAGVALRFADGERRLHTGDAPIRFDGAEAPDCSLIDGPTRDLNLMVRGGTGAMTPVTAGEPWAEPFDARGLFTTVSGRWHQDRLSSAANGMGTAGQGEEHRHAPLGSGLRLAAHTLLWNIGPLPCRFVPDRPGPCGWWLGASDGTT